MIDCGIAIKWDVDRRRSGACARWRSTTSTGSRSRSAPGIRRATRTCAPRRRRGSPTASASTGQGFERVLATGTVDVVGVDPGRAGGITGFKRACDRIELVNRRQANAHAWSSAIVTAASLAISWAKPVCLQLEEQPFKGPMQDDLIGGAFVHTRRLHADPAGPGARHRRGRARRAALPDRLMALPLSDLRIVAVEQYGAGPVGHVAARRPRRRRDQDRGSPRRRGRRPLRAAVRRGRGLALLRDVQPQQALVSLDLKSRPAARCSRSSSRVRRRLLEPARRPARAPRLTIRRPAPVNPRIVCCSLSGFGMTGPRAARRRLRLHVQGMAGWASLTGGPDGPPGRARSRSWTSRGGYVAAIAMVAGVLARTPRRRRLRLRPLALRDGAGRADLRRHVAGEPRVHDRRARATAHPSMVPFQTFAAGDGSIVIACPKQALGAALRGARAPGWAEDPRFTGFAERRSTRRAVSLIEERLAARDRGEWFELLSEAGVPCAPVNSIEQALADKQVVGARRHLGVRAPRARHVRQVGVAAAHVRRRAAERRGPHRGEHTEAVLRELCGYDDEAIARLEGEKR